MFTNSYALVSNLFSIIELIAESTLKFINETRGKILVLNGMLENCGKLQRYYQHTAGSNEAEK